MRRIPGDFEVFYLRTRDVCFRALLATVESSDEADDLLSEAFTRALARWGDVAVHASPEAWVVRTALNLHRDRWRRSQRAQRLRNQRDQVGFVDIVDPGLMAAVRSLPDRQREVVALRVLLGLSADQTADVLSINVGTVSTHLRRGLVRALRRCVEPDAATRHRNR